MTGLTLSEKMIMSSLQQENQDLHERILQCINAREIAEKNIFSLENTVSFLQRSLQSSKKENETLSKYLKEKNVLIGQLKSQIAILSSSLV